MRKLLSSRTFSVILVFLTVCIDADPSLARDLDGRIQDVMRCQKAEERFTLGRDLGAKTGFNLGGGEQLPEALRQRLMEAMMQAMDQVFNWKAVEQDYIRIYAENYSSQQLDYVLKLCQQPMYRQLMTVDLQMIRDSFAVNETFAPQIQEATMKSVQDILR